jgi:MoaA/NifB/PqqE/SkfB family radical SAM enzyme
MQELLVDKDGKVELPATLRHRWGLDSRGVLLVSETPEGIVLRPQEPPPAKVYVEPTTQCNLSCRTCMRNSWTERGGEMPMALYKRLMDDLADFPSIETIAFWGFGEPLLHPHIVEMISLAHSRGIKTELVTNGLLLSRELSEALVRAGLETLVVSVDGTTPESYGEVRSGADFRKLVDNILGLQFVKHKRSCITPEIGIEFVVMRSNMPELPKLPSFAYSLGASFVIVTNVLPYTRELSEEILYWQSAGELQTSSRSRWVPEFKLAPIDLRDENLPSVLSLLRRGNRVNAPLRSSNTMGDHCPFINQRSFAVSWDGVVSPCVPLMHTYTCYVLGREKFIKRYMVGKVGQESIQSMWNTQEYKDFRKRVEIFDFSPCLRCSSCEYSESNEEDCFGNPFPVCGDCLWARGIILCP